MKTTQAKRLHAKSLSFILLLLVFIITSISSSAQTLYSRKTGNWSDGTISTGTWSLIGHAGLACACTPGVGNTVVIGNGHVVTYQSGSPAAVTIAGLIVNDAGGGTLTFGNGATSTTLTVSSNILVNAGGTLQSGATGATAHTIQVAGNLTNDGAMDLSANAATNHTITFNPATTKAILGASGITVYNMSVTGPLTFGDNVNTRVLTVKNDLTVSTTGTLQSGGTAAVAHAIQVAGNLTNSGILNLTANGATNQTITFNAASTKSILGTSGSTFYNMNVTGLLRFGDNLNTRILTIANDLTITSTGSLQSGSTAAIAHTIQLAGNLSNSGTLNLTANAATNHTIMFNAASTKSILGTSGSTFYNMSVTGPLNFGDNLNTRVLTIANDLTVSSTGTLQSGSTAAIAHTIQLAGNLSNSGTLNLTANAATNHTITFNAASTKSILGTSGSTFYNMSVTGPLNFGDNLNTRVLTIANDLTISSTGTLQSGSTAAIAHTIQLAGNLTNSGTLNLAANAATNHTVTFNAASTKSILGTSGSTFYNMNVTGPLNFGDNLNTRVLTIANNLTVGSAGTLQSGSTAAIAHTIQVAGNLTNNGTLNLATNSATNHTITFNAASTKSILGTSGSTFYNMNVTGPLNFGDNLNTRVLTIANNLTVSSTGALQSGSTAAIAHTIQLAGNLTNSGTLNLAANAATNHTIIFNAASTKSILGTSGSTFYNMSVTGPLNFGDNLNTRVLVIANDLNISASGTLQSGITAAVAHTIQVAGNMISDGTFDLTANAATNQSIVFNASTAKTISGSGATFTCNIFTLQTSSSSNLNINRNILINGTLNFAANGLLVVNASSNLTLGIGASFGVGGNAPSNTRYILLDGLTGSNSQLIKTSNGTTASWQINYPIGTATGGYTPVNLSIVGGTPPTSGATLAVKAIYNASIQGQLRRTFRLVVAGNVAVTTFSAPQFNYHTTLDLSSGDAISNYNNIWCLSAAVGSWATVVGTNAGAGSFTVTNPSHGLVTGTYYYTIGTSTAYPNTWYSYQTGVWSNWQNWTLDPSGTTLVNGLNLPPQPGDEIVILNGITITNDVSGQVAANTTIKAGGTLDMDATTSNTLGNVSGSGLLRINGVTLPTGTYTGFVTASTGGTIEYYNTSGTLPTGQTTYNNLLLSNNTSSTVTFVTANDLTINGDFNITQTSGTGTVTWQINDATAATRTLTLNGNLIVSANGQIRAGTGNALTPHDLTMYGNITNNGSIRFFDDTGASPLTDANYLSGAVYTTALRGNAVNVTFRGSTSNTLTLNNQTDFYRFILDKGTGQQAMLTVNSSSTSNFRLFGPNNIARSGTAPNVISNDNLSIINGTLQLTGSINIPQLITDIGVSNSWPIPQNGALWLNSSNVTIQVASSVASGDNKHFQVYGLLRVTNGTFNLGYSRGLLGGGSGSLIVEGGTINTWQLRTTNTGTGNNFAYYQSGGNVNVGTAGLSGVNIDTYPRFSLNYTTCTFQMTGGNLSVGNPMTTGIGINGGIQIASASTSYSVTGGTVNAYIPASATNFTITSTAPFFNLNLFKDGAGSAVAILNSISANDGVSTTVEAAQPLVILNNFTLNTVNSPTLNANGQNITVGGNFDIQSGTTLTPGANTITFNGTTSQAWTHNGTITSLNNVVVNKSAGTLTLGGAGTFPNITGATTGLTLTSGTLDDGGKTITVTGALSNSATHTTTVVGGVIILNGATTIGGASGTFGNLTISSNATVTTSGDQTVTGTLRLTAANTTLNIQSNNLTVLGNIYDAASGVTTVFTNTKRIQTLGLRNDGGLTRQASDATDLLFPVGTATVLYTPAILNVDVNNATGTSGKITLRPVASAHPNLKPTDVGKTLSYYWRVTSTGFANIISVNHKSYTYSTATIGAPAASYVPACYNPLSTPPVWSVTTPTFNAGSTTFVPNFTFGTILDGEYTAGNVTAGAITVFYSRQNGNWNVNTTWSNSPCTSAGVCGPAVSAGQFPGSTSAVVIGDLLNSHTVTIDANSRTAGSLYIENTSTLDCSTFTSLDFGVNTGQSVSGRGTIKIASSTFPAGDFTNFIGTAGGTIEWYGTSKSIPATGPAPQNLVLDNYYNLTINPLAGQTITLPASNFTVYNTFTKNGTGITATDVTASRTISTNGVFNISAGTFNILTNGGNTFVSSFALGGDLTISAGASFVVSGGAATHTLTTSGSITNNGTLDFRNGSVVNLTFTGTSNTSLGGTAAVANATRLNNLTVNKGTSQIPTLTVNVNGASISTLTTGWLTLTNGAINFNNSASFSLNTASSSYSIPSTAKLKVQAGTVDIIGDVNNDAGDLLLAGTLEVAGGTVNVNPIGNNRDINNDIEYAAAGTPTIIVSSGSLYVNGAIRRPTTSLSGALVYNQSAGVVTIGGRNCDANSTRGVFEIEDNTGSSFTLSGGTLNVRRSTGGAFFADLYINPVSSSVSAASTIQFGMDVNTAVTTTLSINIVPTVGNLILLNAGTAQTVNMISSALTTAGTLTINTNCTLDTKSYSVNVGADLAISGTYIGGVVGSNNITTFNGSGTQLASLSASSSFYNLTVSKSSGSTVQLSGTSPTITDLNILTGILDVGSLGLTVTGDITNNSSQVSTPSTGSIIISGASTAHTITSSNGAFHNLTLGGSATTKVITVTGNMTINGSLDFTNTAAINRYLFIGGNSLTFGTGASVSNAGTTGGSIKFIKTNGVSSDFGITKNWPVGTNTFTYALGTRTNYTPVTFTSFNVTTAGSLTISPVDDQHPTSSAMGEQLLSYYWIVTRSSSLVFTATGTHAYTFPTGLISGTSGTLTQDYLDAINLIGWTSGGILATTLPSTTMTFTTALTNLPGVGGEFDYTAGTTSTLPNPVTPVYSRFADADGVSNPTNVSNQSIGGDWNLATNWTLSSTGNGVALSQIPVGRPIVVLPGARMNMNIAGLRSFTSKINGLMVIVNTTGHNLGSLSGTGTLRTTTSTLPAGNYTTFVSSAGGTIEYVAPMTMNNRNTYNNLSVIGSGTLAMTNIDLTLNGSVTLGSGTTLNNSFNNTISIAGDWTNNGGTFTTGTGTVTFNGASSQTITGTTPFNNLTVAKTGNVTLSGTATTTVNNQLTLTTGNIIASATHPLVIGPSATISGGSSSSFIQGPVKRNITAGGTFTFPVGSTVNGRYRFATVANTSIADTWTAEYIGSNPTSSGYSNKTFNSSNIRKVSMFEFWIVSRTAATTADLTLSYNTGSYIAPNIGTVANLRVVRWNGSQWDFPPGAASFSQSGTITAGTVTVTGVTNFSPFTFGSLDSDSPLPIQWLSFNAYRASGTVVLDWKTAQETNSNHFEIEKSNDGKTFTKIGEKLAAGNSIVSQSYRFMDSEVSSSAMYYYRIKQVDTDGGYDFSTIVYVVAANAATTQQWAAYPNPVNDKAHFQIEFIDQSGDISRPVQIQIVSSNGTIVYTGDGSLDQLNTTLDSIMQNLGLGIYLVQVSDGVAKEIFRIAKL